MKISSPDKTYTGTSVYGATTLDFKDGAAEVDDLPAGVRLYLQSAGYGIDSKATPPEAPEIPDPRDSTVEQVGTALRDSAVDPHEEDFLPPTNAGKPGSEGNPHGPHVVSPELHASQGVRPVKGGPVEEADEQEPAELTHAEAAASGDVLTDAVSSGAERPAGNASQEAWAEYATAQGKDVEGLSRNEIRDLFTEE